MPHCSYLEIPLPMHKLQPNDNKCYYCDEKILWATNMQGINNTRRKHSLAKTSEHIIPQSWGGVNHARNIIYSCKDCNKKRGNLPLEEFLMRSDSVFTKERIQALIDYVNENKLDLIRPAGTSNFRTAEFKVDNNKVYRGQGDRLNQLPRDRYKPRIRIAPV